jgi:hypothetical protein
MRIFLWRLRIFCGGCIPLFWFVEVVAPRRCPFIRWFGGALFTVSDHGLQLFMTVDRWMMIDDDDERRVILCVRHKIQNSIVVTHDSCTRER